MDDKLAAARAAIALIFADAKSEFLPDTIDASNEDAVFCHALRSLVFSIPADKLAVLMCFSLTSEQRRSIRGAFDMMQRGDISDVFGHCGWRFDYTKSQYYYPEVVNGRIVPRKEA